MDTVGQRLRYYIESQYGNVKEFAQKNSIHYPGLTAVLNDKRPLGMEVMLQIKKALPNIDTEWLLFANRKPSITNIDNDVKALKEPGEVYSPPDAFENLLLKYLDRENVQKKIREILNLK